MKKDYDLNEVARELSLAVEDLVRFAAHGELTIFVVAEDWAACSTKGGLADDVLDGPVDLVPEDLRRSMNADFTEVRQIRVCGTDKLVTLNKPEQVRRGVHFVTAEEFRRFKLEHASTSLEQHADSPPYLDPRHENYSPELAAAVRAWMNLFADGTFERGNKGVIETIKLALKKDPAKLSSAAIERIATAINPERLKTGGAPPTD